MMLISRWLACCFVNVKLFEDLYMLYIHVTAYFNPNLTNCRKNTTCPPCESSLQSVDRERGQDPLGMLVGLWESGHGVRGVSYGYGPPRQNYLPKSPELPKMKKRCESSLQSIDRGDKILLACLLACGSLVMV